MGLTVGAIIIPFKQKQTNLLTLIKLSPFDYRYTF